MINQIVCLSNVLFDKFQALFIQFINVSLNHQRSKWIDFEFFPPQIQRDRSRHLDICFHLDKISLPLDNDDDDVDDNDHSRKFASIQTQPSEEQKLTQMMDFSMMT